MNLGCGPIFVESSDWVNLDFYAPTQAVKQANLLNKLPLKNDSSSVVYSSHFLEHIPREEVFNFLSECFRVLAPGGTIRLVLPDLQNIANEYISLRNSEQHEKADFLVHELIDQSVRTTTGGRMGDLYNRLRNGEVENSREISDFIYRRVGENIVQSGQVQQEFLSRKISLDKIRSRLRKYWINAVLTLLPSAFREQNISSAEPGERHLWLWDYYQLSVELSAVGFINVSRKTAKTSSILDFPFEILDLDSNMSPRKGNSSMYIEASKPTNGK